MGKYSEGKYYAAVCPRNGKVMAAYSKNSGGVFVCPESNNHLGVLPLGEKRR